MTALTGEVSAIGMSGDDPLQDLVQVLQRRRDVGHSEHQVHFRRPVGMFARGEPPAETFSGAAGWLRGGYPCLADSHKRECLCRIRRGNCWPTSSLAGAERLDTHVEVPPRPWCQERAGTISMAWPGPGAGGPPGPARGGAAGAGRGPGAW